MPTRPRDHIRGFSLIELLVALGIIVILLAIMLPVVSKVRRQAHATKCLANLRTVGQALAVYQNNFGGWVFPVKTDAFGLIGLGGNVPPHERWPMVAMPVAGAPLPPPYNAGAYVMEDHINDPAYNPRPYTPPVLVCPGDDKPKQSHTYVLNNHLADEGIRAGKKVRGVTSGEIVVAGEKREQTNDYCMEWGDYDRVVDGLKHGKTVGSNYL